MELMLFIKDLRNKGALYYQTWMPLLIQYNGEKNQTIKLSVPPNVPKTTYYRVIQYGVDSLPRFINNYCIVKKRNEIIINYIGNNIVEDLEIVAKPVKEKKTNIK